MTKPPKSLFRLLLIVSACLLVAGVIVLIRHQGNQATTPPAREITGQANSSDRPERPERTPGKKPPRGGAAPAASSSDAVAALVGDKSLSDQDVIAGLRRIVDDGSRKIEERLEALEHTLNLIPNEKQDLLREMASRKVMPNEVRMRLAADALNRPHHLQGEILVLLLANAAGDPRKELLKDLTHLCGGEDLGDDLAAWRKALENLPTDP